MSDLYYDLNSYTVMAQPGWAWWAMHRRPTSGEDIRLVGHRLWGPDTTGWPADTEEYILLIAALAKQEREGPRAPWEPRD